MKKMYLLMFGLLSVLAIHAQKGATHSVNIVYIGNSITQGVQIKSPELNAPPAKASEYLREQSGISSVQFSNQGVSGKTTVDFLPASNTFFPKVIAAADQFKDDKKSELVFSIMIGTNDSAISGPNGAPVSASQYYTNVQAIMNALLDRYPKCKIVLHRPIWYSLNTHNASMYLKQGLERLESYLPQLEALVSSYRTTHPGQVFMGDTEAFDYFRDNYDKILIPENGRAGTFYLHPNKQGAEILGNYWGKAIYHIISSAKKR